MKVKKEIFPIDETGFYGELAYGYSNKKEAIRDIEKLTGEKVDIELLQKVRVRKFIDENREDFYFWGNICKKCGAKNDGVWSYLHGE